MITQKHIADSLGMAAKTVSNILSGQSGYRYSEETRQRVLEAAEKMGYRKNRISRAVRTGRSNLIGVINFSSIAEVAQKAEANLPRIINGEGFDYMSIDLGWHGGDIDRVIDELIQARVEGVIVSHMTGAFDSRYTGMLEKVGIPITGIYGDDKLHIPLVADDARSAFCAMTRHLQSLGHRRLLLLINDYDARPARHRMEGFQLAMNDFAGCQLFKEDLFFERGRKRFPWDGEAGGIILRIDLAKTGHSPARSYYQAAKRFFKMGGRPDAIICSNDIAAFGIFTAAFEEGIRVPDDLAITGADNDLFGEFPLYGLTTMEKDLEGACTKAVELLVAKIRKKTVSHKTELLPSELVLRKSCGRRVAASEETRVLVPTIPPIHPQQTLSI